MLTKLYKSLLIHMSNVILWASVTRTKLGHVQKPHTALFEMQLLSRALHPSLSLPVLLVPISAEGLHHSVLRRRENTSSCHLAAQVIPGVNQLTCMWEEIGPLPPLGQTQRSCAYFTIRLGTQEQECNIVSYVTIYLFWLRAASRQI